MYHFFSQQDPLSMAVPMPCEPDYETIIARKKGDLEVLKNFQTSLTDFIKAIGNNALTLNGIKFSLEELFGKVQIDIISTESDLNNLLKEMEIKQ